MTDQQQPRTAAQVEKTVKCVSCGHPVWFLADEFDPCPCTDCGAINERSQPDIFDGEDEEPDLGAQIAELRDTVAALSRDIVDDYAHIDSRIRALESPAAAPVPDGADVCRCGHRAEVHPTLGNCWHQSGCDCRKFVKAEAAPELVCELGERCDGSCQRCEDMMFERIYGGPAEPPVAVPDAAPTDTVNGLVEAARAVVDGWESLDDGRYSISEEAMTNLGIALEAASPGSVLIVSLSDEDEKYREAAERLLDILTLEQVSALGNDRMNRLFGTIHAIRAYGRDGAR